MTCNRMAREAKYGARLFTLLSGTLAVTLFFLKAELSTAGVGEWIPSGSYGGFLLSLAMGPVTPCAASAGTHGDSVLGFRSCQSDSDCDDSNPCTDDSCSSAQSCVNILNTDPCDDGDLCTANDTCSSGICAGTLDVTSCLDHFLCYRTWGMHEIEVTLSDRFDSGTYKGSTAKQFCTPVDENGEGIVDPTTHLTGYRIRGLHERQADVEVENQFGTFLYDTVMTETLMVPSTKSILPAPPPGPLAPESMVDHYRCLRVRTSMGAPKFPRGLAVILGDQFASRTVIIKKPAKLCLPVDKNSEGIKSPEAHLMCYTVKSLSRTRVKGVQVVNQFGLEALRLRGERELCVPSLVRVATATTSTSSTTTTTTATTTTTGVSLGCPSRLSFEANAGISDLDVGWTGISHDKKVVGDSILTVRVTGCDNANRPCGVCSFTGPVRNVEKANNQRCTGDSSIECTSDGDCTGDGTCAFFAGAPLPLSSGAVPVCVVDRVVGQVTGTANIESGDANTSVLNLVASVHTGIKVDQPCPTCDGDATPLDGSRDGACSGGERDGMACDVGGRSLDFGSTSFDCPPLSGANIGNLSIKLGPIGTGTVTKTLTASSPNCTASGWGTLKCFCDTCATLNAEPCFSDADCPGGPTCGGKRCAGGSNNGGSCSLACPAGLCNASGVCERGSRDGESCDCPTGRCTRPGQPSQAHACLTDCVDSGGGVGVCPDVQDQLCNIDRFRGCNTAADCPADGDTCGSFLRPCFLDNGLVGGSVTATGAASVPVDMISTPTMATLFCIAPTSSSAVNVTAGLPGLGRLELPGTVKQIDSGAPFPVALKITTISGSRGSFGWTGISHEQAVVEETFVEVNLNDCDPAGPDFDCVVDGAHLVGQQFGPPLPIATGGVPICVVKVFSEPVTGTFNLQSGCSALSARLTSSVHTAQRVFQPCPLCEGDPVMNDGVKGGICNDGPDQGQPCDVNGITPVLGATSKDCLPNPGANIGDLDIVMPQLGSGSITVVAGETGVDTCLAIDRSTGQPFSGCFCPDEIRPNACDDSTCSAAEECLGGPTDTLCSGSEFRFAKCSGVGTTLDCEEQFAGLGTCQSFIRPCFQPTITRTGICGTQTSTLVGFFCIPSTTSGAVNLTGGLPGPGVVELNVRLETREGRVTP